MFTKTLLYLPLPVVRSPHGWRPLFYITNVFNSVDRERLRAVGPDRLCAEWILKNGGAVRLSQQRKRIKDYNDLPADEMTPIRLRDIDATRATINALGMDHLEGCKYVNRLVLDECRYVDNASLAKLEYLRGRLEYLQVSNCDGVDDEGLLKIGAVSGLKKLNCFQLKNVKDLLGVEKELQKLLYDCRMKMTPYAA